MRTSTKGHAMRVLRDLQFLLAAFSARAIALQPCAGTVGEHCPIALTQGLALYAPIRGARTWSVEERPMHHSARNSLGMRRAGGGVITDPYQCSTSPSTSYTTSVCTSYNLSVYRHAQNNVCN